MTAPKTAMVLAAGLGTRMRPLTDDRPKALVELGGRALIDHVLDRLAEAGVVQAVVNVHWFADRLEGHLADRQRPAITFSDERAELLETGGGLRKAAPLLGTEPVFVANIDSVWIDRGDAIADLARLWDPVTMDACLLLARREGSIGFEGDGDFFLAGDGRLTFRGDAPSAPFAYMGLHITRPDYADGGPDGPFSLSPLWRASAAAGRLYGCVLDGDWMHVGDPRARDEAEARLAGSSLSAHPRFRGDERHKL
jgi:MurNAc alpha-1-phosphate uridylyltransferase